MSDPYKFDLLVGKTLTGGIRDDDYDTLTFVTSDGERYQQFHSQDCCESVHIEEIVGDLDDLIGTPILLAEEVESENETPEGMPSPQHAESYTWTFYKLATAKGHVTIRWLGESNGYYSESVDFRRVLP